MTKLRDPLTYKATLATVASVIGWDMCATLCGAKSGETVRRWSDPDCKTEIRMIDAERLDLAFIQQGGDHAPFNRLLSLRLDLANHPFPDVCFRRTAGQIAIHSASAIDALLIADLDPSAKTIRNARAAGEAAISIMKTALAAIERRDTGESK